MPGMAVFVYLFGGILGWISLVLFLSILGFDLLVMGVLGLFLMFIALYLDKKNAIEPLFILTLMLVGHIHLMVSLHEGLQIQLYVLLLIELFFMVISFTLFSSIVYRYIQSFILFALVFMLPFEYHYPLVIHYLILIISVFLLVFLWLRPLAKFLLLREVLMVTQSIYLFVLISSSNMLIKVPKITTFAVEKLSALLLTLGFALILFYLYPILRKNTPSYLALIGLAIVGIYGSPGITISVIYLLLATFSKERGQRILALVLAAAFIFYFYHSLQLPLDQKGLILMSSGGIFMLLSLTLRKPKKSTHE